MYAGQVKWHNVSAMALLYIIIALVIQGSITYANITNTEDIAENSNFVNSKPDLDDEVIKDFHYAKKDWYDFFLLPDTHLYPSSSVAMMTQVTNSDKSAEEQLQEIQEVAHKITMAIQSDMANLLAYALSACDKEEEVDDNKLRKRRSVESPMASTQLVTRLLKHIKSNNEYQNIAIEKMMTAQEIADKYGIEFSPDTEILSDLAFAANEQAKEMNNLLQESIEAKNVTRKAKNSDNGSTVQYPEQHQTKQQTVNAEPSDYHHHHYTETYPSYNYYNYPYETQIPSPVQNYYSPPVSKRPNFYDTVSYAPLEYSYCTMEPMTSASVFVPIEEFLEPEPELVGEEFEETVSSKVYVERGDEPGSATVNHVMTYTVGEKSYFRTPEIERLPQQFQYSFFLI